MGQFLIKDKPKIKTNGKTLMLASLIEAASGSRVVTTCSSAHDNQLAPTCVSIKLINEDEQVQESSTFERKHEQQLNKDNSGEKSTNCKAYLSKHRQQPGVHEVKLAFIGLARFKRLQYFYLAALIYSVISILLTLSFSARSSGTCRTPSVDDALTDPPNTVTLLILLGSSILLSFPLAVLSLRSALARPKWAESSAARLLGLICVLGLLELPTLTLILQLNSHTSGSDCSSSTGTAPSNFVNAALSYRLLIPTLAIHYLTPILFEGSRIGVLPQLVCTAFVAVLPVLGIIFSITSEEASANYSEMNPLSFICWIIISLLAGLLRRLRFTHLIGHSAFAQADQLIEAKVSLEHQRQQQETLLLSVLPAYVAEQVKRNMVKRITSSVFQGNSNPTTELSAQNQPSSYSATVITTSNSSNQATEPHHVKTEPLKVTYSISKSIDDSSPTINTPALSVGNSTMIHNNLQATRRPFNSFFASPFINKSLSREHHPSTLNFSASTCSTTTAQVNSALQVNQQPVGHSRRGFNELYIRTYNNVSLLYGDIVGFTKLCTQLSSSQLVRILNDLFSHFDHLAERHRIMRIKILGDCYYGVAGIPEFAVTGSKSHKLSRLSHTDNHAINCVNMGLDMINYICRLNIERAGQHINHLEKTKQTHSLVVNEFEVDQQAGMNWPAFELNMRIGIHTGHIHSGVIGLKKWQFDVWSNDVSIAMHCESSGVAGRIHVTEATIQQLEGAFTYELAQGAQRDSFLASKDIRTYLICDRSRQHQMNSTMSKSQAFLPKQSSLASIPQQLDRSKQSGELQVSPTHQKAAVNCTDEENIRATTIGTIKQTLMSGEDQVTQQHHTDLTSSHLSSRLSFNWHDLHPLTLKFRDTTIARLYDKRKTLDITYELLIINPLFLLLTLSQVLPTPHFSFIKSSISFLVLAQTITIPILAILVLATLELKQKKHRRKGKRMLTRLSKKGYFNGCFKLIRKKLYDLLGAGKGIPKRVRDYCSILIVIIVISIEFYTISRYFCDDEKQAKHFQSGRYQLSVILLLICMDFSVNLIGYRTKLCLITSILVMHLLPILPINVSQQVTNHTASNLLLSRCTSSKSKVYLSTDTVDSRQPLIHWFSWTLLFVMILWTFLLAEQVEYAARTSFLWRNKLSVDHEELEYISGINKLLLENILPSHVVQHYMTQPLPDAVTSNALRGTTGSQQTLATNSLGHCSKNNHAQLSASFANLQNYMRMSFNSIRNNSGNHELYHEQHESVAVMFASIPHFYEFYDESDINKQGLGCIALLNEIICDFDKLLLKNKFSRIEKIKTIGSTYMAAAGLRPNILTGARNSTVSEMSFNDSVRTSFDGNSIPIATSCAQKCSNKPSDTSTAIWRENKLFCNEEQRKQVLSQQKLNLICIIQFATSLMSALNGINKQSFQVFKLRVGVNAGSVIAGVIGAQRPFYDIWGDCVNIASRMESLGVVGRIQVEEKTAHLLMESLCTENYFIVKRGPIDVKGKGGMVTYFVDKKKSDSTSTCVREQHQSLDTPNCASKLDQAVNYLPSSQHQHHHQLHHHHHAHPSQTNKSPSTSKDSNNNLLSTTC